MIKNIFIVLSVVTVVVALIFVFSDDSDDSKAVPGVEFAVSAVEHASFGLLFADASILNDPVGDPQAYAGVGIPDIIFISDIHPDHFDVDTLAELVAASTTIIAPEAVFDALPAFLKDKTVVMANGDSHTVAGVMFEAVPMYNLPSESDTVYHEKGRGNGYILESGGTRIYIAGDTADTPEMRALQDIDVAFVPVNLPYTMDETAAASAVLEFAPSIVYPYHYRGEDGLADVLLFEELIQQGNPTIEVRQLDWYNQQL